MILLSDVIFEGRRITLLECNESHAKGIIIACGNTHLFLDHSTVAELIQGLNENSYDLFKTRKEIFQ
jgi:hypothetical protein